MAGTMDEKWVRRFLGLCDHIAAWSEDRDFHVGCVIVGPAHEIRATGYNGLPRGVKDGDEARFDRKSGENFSGLNMRSGMRFITRCAPERVLPDVHCW